MTRVESQHSGVGKGPLGIIQFNLSAKVRSLIVGYPGSQYPGGFGISAEKMTAQSPWSACSNDYNSVGVWFFWLFTFICKVWIKLVVEESQLAFVGLEVHIVWHCIV